MRKTRKDWKRLLITYAGCLTETTMAEENKYLSLAAGNIPSVKLLLPSNLNVKDLLEADFVVMTEKAVSDVTERLQ